MAKTDLEIISALRKGERQAFYSLYHRYSDLIYRNILVRVNSSFDADDIFQDFFVEVWEKRKDIQIQSNVKAYLLTWLKHHILNKIKEQQVRYRCQGGALQYTEEAEDYTWVKITSEDLKLRLREVVNTFPERLKLVYILSREQNMSIKEIAEKLSVSEQTVKNQLTDILKRLKNEMNNKNFLILV